jgi:hypothetical protein
MGRIEFDRRSGALQRLVIAPGADQRRDRVEPVRQRIQLLRPPLRRDRLVVRRAETGVAKSSSVAASTPR